MIEFLKSPGLSFIVVMAIIVFGIVTMRPRTKMVYRKPYASVVKSGLLMVTGNITKLEQAITSPVERYERLESDVYYVYLKTDNIETTKAIAQQINTEC